MRATWTVLEAMSGKNLQRGVFSTRREAMALARDIAGIDARPCGTIVEGGVSSEAIRGSALKTAIVRCVRNIAKNGR